LKALIEMLLNDKTNNILWFSIYFIHSCLFINKCFPDLSIDLMFGWSKNSNLLKLAAINYTANDGLHHSFPTTMRNQTKIMAKNTQLVSRKKHFAFRFCLHTWRTNCAGRIFFIQSLIQISSTVFFFGIG
jgi:hypothetical protein